MDQNRTVRLTELPESFAQQMAPNYLGNPVVVAGIVAGFMTEIVTWMQARAAGTMSAKDMTDHAYERAPEFAAIFAGENPEYEPIAGWNTRVGGLQEALKADLSHYWQSQRAAHGDDPYRVLYAWLVWAVVDAHQSGDDDMANATMGQRTQQLIRMLTGSTKRKGA